MPTPPPPPTCARPATTPSHVPNGRLLVGDTFLWEPQWAMAALPVGRDSSGGGRPCGAARRRHPRPMTCERVAGSAERHAPELPHPPFYGVPCAVRPPQSGPGRVSGMGLAGESTWAACRPWIRGKSPPIPRGPVWVAECWCGCDPMCSRVTDSNRPQPRRQPPPTAQPLLGPPPRSLPF